MTRKSRLRPKKSTNPGLDKKLARYALAGGAVLASPLAAHAQIVYSGIVNDPISIGTSVMVNFPGTASLTLSAASDYSPASAFFAQSITAEATSMMFVGSGPPAALTFGSLISTANATGPGGVLLKYGTGPTPGGPVTGFKNGNWPQNHSPAYLGFAFTTVGQTYTGWANISVDVDSNLGAPTGTLVDYAYNQTANDSITAGQTSAAAPATPEPSSLALLALGGAAGLALLRRRRALQNNS